MLGSVTYQAIIFSAYGATIISGLLFNAIFIVSVAVWLEKKRSVTRMLIANLAFSDVLMLLNSFFSPISSMNPSWSYGEICCKLMPMVSALSTYVSSFSATAIALHRFVSIVKPQWRKLQPNSCCFVIAAVWSASFGLSLPIFVQTKLTEYNSDNSSIQICRESWDSAIAGQSYTIASLVLQFVVPSLIIATCYGRVNCVLSERLRFHMSRTYHSNQARILTIIRRQRRTTRTLTLMVASYIACWTPLNAFVVVYTFKPDIWFLSFAPIFYVAAHILATSSALYNPIIYVWMHDEFRRQAGVHLRRCCATWSRRRKQSGISRQFMMKNKKSVQTQAKETAGVTAAHRCDWQQCQLFSDSSDQSCYNCAQPV